MPVRRCAGGPLRLGNAAAAGHPFRFMPPRNRGIVQASRQDQPRETYIFRSVPYLWLMGSPLFGVKCLHGSSGRLLFDSPLCNSIDWCEMGKLTTVQEIQNAVRAATRNKTFEEPSLTVRESCVLKAASDVPIHTMIGDREMTTFRLPKDPIYYQRCFEPDPD